MTGIGEIGERLRRSTVHVVVSPGRGGASGSGSGVIWNASGLVITNAHVARTDRLRVELWDGRNLPATVVKRHPHRDLASLQLDPAQLRGTHLEPAAIADSSALRPCELVVAVGNPLGFHGAMSTGVVHAIGPVRGLGHQPWVQAGVRLAPGNSGGPLADAQGRVIGINTMVVSGGLGLAIPSNAVTAFLAAAAPPRLGVSIRPVRVRSNRGESAGLMILEVEQGGAADAASILPGDVLVSANGRRFEAPSDLGEALEQTRAVVRLEFVRGGSRTVREVSVRLREPTTEAA